jgi:hypothetical protein
MRAPWEEAKRARLIMGNPTAVRRWLNIENPLDIPQAVAIMLRKPRSENISNSY